MICLSKSKYLAGLQCSKLLWFHYHGKEHFPTTDESIQEVYDQGHAVGNLAKRLFPDGVEIETVHTQFAETLRRSRLEKYCGPDTLGMTLIVDRLKKLSAT